MESAHFRGTEPWNFPDIAYIKLPRFHSCVHLYPRISEYVYSDAGEDFFYEFPTPVLFLFLVNVGST